MFEHVVQFSFTNFLLLRHMCQTITLKIAQKKCESICLKITINNNSANF